MEHQAGIIRILIEPDLKGFEEKMQATFAKYQTMAVGVGGGNGAAPVATGSATAMLGNIWGGRGGNGDLTDISNQLNGVRVSAAGVNQELGRTAQLLSQISTALVRTGAGPRESVYIGPRPDMGVVGAGWGAFAGTRAAPVIPQAGPFVAGAQGVAAGPMPFSALPPGGGQRMLPGPMGWQPDVIDAEWTPAGQQALGGMRPPGGAAALPPGAGAAAGAGLHMPWWGRGYMAANRAGRWAWSNPVIGGRAGMGIFMNALFGGWEIATASRSISIGEMQAAMANSPIEAMQAQAAAIQQASAGPMGSIIGMVADAFGQGPAAVQRQTMMVAAAYQSANNVRNLTYQNIGAREARAMGIGSYSGQLALNRRAVELDYENQMQKASELEQQAKQAMPMGSSVIGMVAAAILGPGAMNVSASGITADAKLYTTAQNARLNQARLMREAAESSRLDAVAKVRFEADMRGPEIAGYAAESAYSLGILSGRPQDSLSIELQYSQRQAAIAAQRLQLGKPPSGPAPTDPKQRELWQAQIDAYKQGSAALQAADQASLLQAAAENRNLQFSRAQSVLELRASGQASLDSARRNPYASAMNQTMFANAMRYNAAVQTGNPELIAEAQWANRQSISAVLSDTLQTARVQSMEMAGTNNVLSLTYGGSFDEAQRERIRNRAAVERLNLPNGPDFANARTRIATRESYELSLLEQQIGYRAADLAGQGKTLDFALAMKPNEARIQDVENSTYRAMRSAGSAGERQSIMSLGQQQMNLLEQQSVLNGRAIAASSPWSLNFAGGETPMGGAWNVAPHSSALEDKLKELNVKEDLNKFFNPMDSGGINGNASIGGGKTLQDVVTSLTAVVTAINNLAQSL